MIERHGAATDASLAAARVRKNVLNAAIAAALMLYFAYSGGGYIMPEGDDAIAVGGAIFIRTLKLGGFAMLAASLGSLTGVRHALLFDGVCSMIIGLLFCASGVLMMIGGGGGVLYIVFGVMFLVAGARNASEWAALAPPPRDGRIPPTAYRSSLPPASMEEPGHDERS